MDETDNKRDLSGRDNHGRFAFGNPGRPFGAKAKTARAALEQIKNMKDGAIQKLGDAVTKGERWAVEFVLSKILPLDRTVEFEEISVADITAALKAGDISPDEAKSIAQVFTSFREIDAVEDIQSKIAELENAVKDDK